jgi:iron-sulfur cluster repair protein YtfE (RIC family)
MTSITHALTRLHRECDGLFIGAENAVVKNNWDAAQHQFHRFRTILEQHLQDEEQVLFPAFERRSGNSLGPTRMMSMEHIPMRELLQAMELSLTQRNRQQYLGQSETLLALMQQHNVKEENVLYPMTDRVLQGEQADILQHMRPPGDATEDE